MNTRSCPYAVSLAILMLIGCETLKRQNQAFDQNWRTSENYEAAISHSQMAIQETERAIADNRLTLARLRRTIADTEQEISNSRKLREQLRRDCLSAKSR